MRTKRFLDLLIGIPVLLACVVPMLVITSLVRFKLGSPVLFRQVRPGLKGEPFELLKFRTMLEAVDAKGDPLPDEARLTPLGRFLRSTSLDELPSLWNVVKGEMSLVGPRPLLMEYLPLYSPEQARRLDVPPGLTGWAQINGRNTISWGQKFMLDVWYVDHRSIGLDLKILWHTAFKVFRREGISAAGEATMPRFRGETE